MEASVGFPRGAVQPCPGRLPSAGVRTAGAEAAGSADGRPGAGLDAAAAAPGPGASYVGGVAASSSSAAAAVPESASASSAPGGGERLGRMAAAAWADSHAPTVRITLCIMFPPNGAMPDNARYCV